jgi:hypothetical protein
MTTFTPDQWVILGLAFALGLFLGMALLASPKWKRRYREEVTRREAVEAENAQLRRDANEMESLHAAAARDEARRRPDPLPPRTVALSEDVRRPADAAALRAAADREEATRPTDAATLRAEAARVEAEHPGEAESLRQAAARDEERRRAETRPL